MIVIEEYNEDVKEFIFQHSFLVPVILEVSERVHKLFGCQDSNIKLILESDEGCPNCAFGEYSKLWLKIKTKKEFSEASTLLDQLEEKYWLDQPYEIHKLMNIDLEYV